MKNLKNNNEPTGLEAPDASAPERMTITAYKGNDPRLRAIAVEAGGREEPTCRWRGGKRESMHAGATWYVAARGAEPPVGTLSVEPWSENGWVEICYDSGLQSALLGRLIRRALQDITPGTRAISFVDEEDLWMFRRQGFNTIGLTDDDRQVCIRVV